MQPAATELLFHFESCDNLCWLRVQGHRGMDELNAVDELNACNVHVEPGNSSNTHKNTSAV
jgi:hypothetical protein